MPPSLPIPDSPRASYTLWSDTGPDGSTSKVIIYPRRGEANVVAHLNGKFADADRFDSVEAAERRGWEVRQSWRG